MLAELRQAEALLLRTQARLGELERLREQQRIAAMQAATEGIVEGGTRTVQVLHYGIAAIPFTILELIPPTRDATRRVRQTHHFIADRVYGSISAVNRGVGALLRQLFKR
jgi:hypothetical protein